MTSSPQFTNFLNETAKWSKSQQADELAIRHQSYLRELNVSKSDCLTYAHNVIAYLQTYGLISTYCVRPYEQDGPLGLDSI